MMGLFSLSFSAPYLLLALLALPGLWVLLRVNPPRPQAVPFPPLPLLMQNVAKQPEPRRLPLWLVILRMVLSACVLLASAGPSINPDQLIIKGSGPVLLILDSGWAAAQDWSERLAVANDIANEADRAGRPMALLATNDTGHTLSLQSPSIIKDRLHSLVPAAFAVDRADALPKVEAFLGDHADAEIVFISDGVTRQRDQNIVGSFARLASGHRVTVLAQNEARLALAGLSNSSDGLSVHLVRDVASQAQAGRVRGYDSKSRVIGAAPFSFEASAMVTNARFVLPTELRNEIARVELEGVRSAGAVALVDGQNRRRKIGLLSGTSADVAQPLLSPNWFVAQALRPYADLIEPRGGISEAVGAMIDAKVSLIVMADLGNLSGEVEKRLSDYVAQGGVLVRFAGPRMATMRDALMPVRIRPGDRALGGALSWEIPKTLAPFPPESPFAGLDTPSEITVTRQLLAEPDADLAHKTWAALSDGTPIVTAEKRGRGSIILFHITADTSWSSMQISGVFVGMLRRIIALSGVTDGTAANSSVKASLAPFKTLNGFGVLGEPMPSDLPADRAGQRVADHDHPAGLYGDPENPFALNVLESSDTLLRIDFSGLDALRLPLERSKAIDLRFWLLMIAALLFAADTIATFLLRGGDKALVRRSVAMTPLVSLFVLASLFLVTEKANAGPIAPKDAEGALQTHLAYVVTGDAALDEESRAGLTGLSAFIAERTALEPGDAVGVDLANDDLAVYPLIYWPMAPGRPIPNAASLAKVDAFMRDGGTVIFDTHDAALASPGSDATPETRALRSVLAGLSVPELEPVPADHVLTKAFYLINRFPGRYAEGKTWIEALPKGSPDSDQPVRAGDGVSPIIITSNDLAAAWATNRNGDVLYPLTQSMPRQREMAMRAGTNIVMYVLTGNYKADQVHVPALLERLGK